MLFIVLLSLLLVSDIKSQKCSLQRTLEVDACASRLFIIGDRKAIIPKTIQEMSKYCVKFRKANKCVKNYSNQCLTPFPRQVSVVLYQAIDANIRKICATNTDRQEFVRKASCINKNIDILHECMENFIELLERSTKIDMQQRIQTTCCYSSKFVQCMENRLSEICDTESREYIKEFLMSYTDHALSSICGELKNNKCTSLPKLPPRDTRKARSLSPYLPMVQLFSNF